MTKIYTRILELLKSADIKLLLFIKDNDKKVPLKFAFINDDPVRIAFENLFL